MTRKKDPHGRGKIMIIGGAIANFTDVAKTFTGIIQAFEIYADKMKEIDLKIYVRRGGPNYEKGLKDIKRLQIDLVFTLKFMDQRHMLQTSCVWH